jgi:transcriptional regulator with XRE-family HTH domain
MMVDYEAFVKRLRTLAGDNVSEFARTVGVKQSVVHRYLQGSMRPGFGFFQRLDACNINIHWLFSGRGEPRLSHATRINEQGLGYGLEDLDPAGKALVRELVASYKRITKGGKRK